MNSLEITHYLAEKICNKKVIITENDANFFQDSEKIIVPNSWAEALHEIAHWLACDPKYRNVKNLGLPIPGEDVSPERVKNVYTDECVALALTKKLYNNFPSEAKEL